MTPTEPLARTASQDRSVILDVFRGLAVLAVILLHSGSHGIGHGAQWYDQWVWPVICQGYLGVQLFFVLSGYCIQGAVESAQRADSPPLTFLRRRIRRIYPPFWWSLIAAALMGLGTMVVFKKSWSELFPLTVSDWLLNIVLLQGPVDAPNVQTVYWSLTIEVQFYFLMGLALLCGRWGATFHLTVSAAYVGWVCIPTVPIAGTVFAYWPEFAAGIAVYYAIHHGRRGQGIALGFVALCLASISVWLTHAPPVFLEDAELSTPYKQLFCLGCGFVLYLAHGANAWASRSRVCRGLAAAGVISYSLYLTHTLVSARIFNLSTRVLDLRHGVWMLVTIVSWMAQLLFGWGFFHLCERPWLNSRGSVK